MALRDLGLRVAGLWGDDVGGYEGAVEAILTKQGMPCAGQVAGDPTSLPPSLMTDLRIIETMRIVSYAMQEATDGVEFVTRIGAVGLGAMGGQIAGWLLPHAHTVVGTNRTRTKAEALIAQGSVWYDTPKATAERSDVVFGMVTTGTALEAVTEKPDRILGRLAPGAVYGMTSEPAHRPLPAVLIAFTIVTGQENASGISLVASLIAALAFALGAS